MHFPTVSFVSLEELYQYVENLCSHGMAEKVYHQLKGRGYKVPVLGRGGGVESFSKEEENLRIREKKMGRTLSKKSGKKREANKRKEKIVFPPKPNGKSFGIRNFILP